DRVAVRITTHGAEGAVIDRRGEKPHQVGVVPARSLTDPTGGGDAFRAGFLAGRSWGLPLERSAEVGSLLATLCLESVGPQEYAVDRGDALARLAAAYGDDSAKEIAPHLPSH